MKKPLLIEAAFSIYINYNFMDYTSCSTDKETST